MTDAIEAQFALLPADVRLTILSALQERVILRDADGASDEAAAILVRLGYAGTAESARKVRATLAAL